MPDNKSKLPDLGEISSMAGKLFKDIKTSITQIIEDYKTKHTVPDSPPPATTQKKEDKAPVDVKSEPSASPKSEPPVVSEEKPTTKAKTDTKASDESEK